MKKISRKSILFTGMVLTAFVFILLIGFLLNPALSYAHQTEIEGIHIYHQQSLDPQLAEILKESRSIILRSELYDPELQIDVCLNDGSSYPGIVESILGQDVIRSFSNKNVVLAPTDTTGYVLLWRDKRFKFSQMLAHVMVHNLQYHHHGFWGSNPLAQYPEWKWEGYADYVVLGKQYSLEELFEAYQTNQGDEFSFISLKDGEGTLKLHIRFLLLTKFCLEEKRVDYSRFMETKWEEKQLWEEIINTFAPSPQLSF